MMKNPNIGEADIGKYKILEKISEVNFEKLYKAVDIYTADTLSLSAYELRGPDQMLISNKI